VELRLRQEVLARFPDDGWFYFGVVWAIVAKNMVYKILDGAGNLTDITRSDMLLEEDEGYAAIEVSKYVNVEISKISVDYIIQTNVNYIDVNALCFV